MAGAGPLSLAGVWYLPLAALVPRKLGESERVVEASRAAWPSYPERAMRTAGPSHVAGTERNEGKKRMKIARRILIALLIIPVVVWLGASVALKLTMAADMPFGQVLGLVGGGMGSFVVCSVTGCDAELPDGLESKPFDGGLMEATPVALDVDEWGRVYLAETSRQDAGAEDNRSHPYWLMDDLASRTTEDRRAYYTKHIANGNIEDPDRFTRESDRLVVLEDRDGDGKADTRSVLAAWNDMVSGVVAGVEAREGSIWVTSIPSLRRLEDQDRDGVAESEEELLTGFGVKTSLIGHDLHGLVWGPDGKLYFSVGDRGYHLTLADGTIFESSMGPGRGAVFRMNGDGSGLEVFATGVRNPQELAFDDHGNLFTGDNNGDGGDRARIVYLVEGGETGWAMPFQTLTGDYIRGPWVAERLWDLQHETQPAWVLPPVAHLGNGPAGFVHYPGLGLPERYRDHFFLADYAYMPGRSGIWSFALEPKGAGFEMIDSHPFIWSILATDFDFSWDGRMFATVFDQFGGTRRIDQIEHAELRADPRIAQMPAIVQEPMHKKSSERLLALLAFQDQRIRLRAQYELAKRGEPSGLVELANDETQALVTRLHALWALGQIGPAALDGVSPGGGAPLGGSDEANEYRAQWAKTVGDAEGKQFASALRAGLRDEAPRVRFFSAQALGALADLESVPDLFEAIAENADRDVFLRHAAVWALHQIGDLESVWARAEDGNRSVRLAVLLVLRQAGDGRIAAFLEDADPLLIVEAARAIYDWPIDAAMPALASLAASISPAAAEDTQLSQALHRRVIGANLRLRTEAGAKALARYAADERQLLALRELALTSLAEYSEPAPRDLTQGFYRPLADADPALLASVLGSEGNALMESSLSSRVIEIASNLGVLMLKEDELLELVRGPEATESEQVSALSALSTLAARTGTAEDRAAASAGDAAQTAPAREAVELASTSSSAAVRSAGRDLLLALDPEAGLQSFLAAAEGASSEAERKQGWRRLGEIDDARARAVLTQGLVYWQSGELPASVALEVKEAALAQGDQALAELVKLAFADSPADPVESRRWALAGGDPAAGQVIFQTTGDCQRCHRSETGVGGGHGGGAGPSLAGVSKKGARSILESVVVPNAQIVEGFGSIVVTRQDGSKVAGLLVEESTSRLVLDIGGGKRLELSESEIASRTDPVTGMPPVGRSLPPRALRDVIAYVQTL